MIPLPSIHCQAFQLRELLRFGIKAPKCVASKHQGRCHVQNIIGAKAFLRRVAVREVLKDCFNGLRRDRRMMITKSQINLVEETRFSCRSKLWSNSQLLHSLPCHENTLLKGIHDLQSVQPSYDKSFGTFKQQCFSLVPVRHVHQRVREKVGIRVNHGSSPAIIREMRSESSLEGGTNPMARIFSRKARCRSMNASASCTRLFGVGSSGLSTKLPPLRLRIVTCPNFCAAISSACGWRFISRTVNVLCIFAAAGARRLADFLAAVLVFMSDMMADIGFRGKFQFSVSLA